MFNLIFFGIVSAAVISGYWVWHASVIKEGAAAQLAKDKPVLETCVADRNKAVDANATLQADVARIRGEIKTANAAMDQLEASAKVAAEAKARALARAQGTIGELQLDKARNLTSRQMAGTCEDKLGRIGTELDALVVREMRDRPVPTVPEAKEILRVK